MRPRRACCFLAVLSFVLTVAGCADATSSDGVQLGKRVPEFSLKTSTNEKLTDRSLEGQVVLLNFWSTTCGPCVKEVPELQKLEDASQATIVGIALEGTGWQTVKPFLKRHHITFRVALGDENLFDRFGGVGIPYSVLLDPAMRVVKIYRGPVTYEGLEADIQTLRAGLHVEENR